MQQKAVKGLAAAVGRGCWEAVRNLGEDVLEDVMAGGSARGWVCDRRRNTGDFFRGRFLQQIGDGFAKFQEAVPFEGRDGQASYPESVFELFETLFEFLTLRFL